MNSFKKIPLARQKLGKINTKIMKQSKKPGIQVLSELNIDNDMKKAIGNVLPMIEKIKKSGLEKTVKSALIADLIQNTPLEDQVSFRPVPRTPKPRYSSTPMKHISPLRNDKVFQYSGKEHSLLRQIPEFYNTKYEVVDKQGDVIPNSDINRVLSFLEKPTTRGKRGPEGSRAFIDDVGVLAYKLEKIGQYIRNEHAVDRLLNKKRKLEEEEIAYKKKQQIGKGWKSLGIRY